MQIKEENVGTFYNLETQHKKKHKIHVDKKSTKMSQSSSALLINLDRSKTKQRNKNCVNDNMQHISTPKRKVLIKF